MEYVKIVSCLAPQDMPKSSQRLLLICQPTADADFDRIYDQNEKITVCEKPPSGEPKEGFKIYIY